MQKIKDQNKEIKERIIILKSKYKGLNSFTASAIAITKKGIAYVFVESSYMSIDFVYKGMLHKRVIFLNAPKKKLTLKPVKNFRAKIINK